MLELAQQRLDMNGTFRGLLTGTCVEPHMWSVTLISNSVGKKKNRMRKAFDSAHLCVRVKVRQRSKSRHVEKKIIW
ncbi:hypothetical protein EXN66_Car009844 [Channa argus]|uniref:Uncharacterized protein n=1 Tax=Channa argus TaxID=215402 RepID=A0A6G1PW12_CHAAH|nr:hypothetical protein EXN66_Car009844 [Channa argus]